MEASRNRSLDNPNSGAETDGQQQTTAGAELASAQPQGPAASLQRPTHPQPSRKMARRCRFFGTKKGCRAGDACPYLHEAASPDVEAASGASSHPRPDGSPSHDDISEQVATGNSGRPESRSTGTNRHVNAPVQKPIPKAQKDAPREFQINQLRRRFHPKEQNDESGTVLTFGMAPTDPDFPFEMDELQCVLHIPRDYPLGRPSLRVTNPDMPRGFQINVEKGFDKLVDSAVENNRQTTLLGLMNSLDRNLERLLTAEKAPTIKFVANVGSREDAKSAEKTAAEKIAAPTTAQSDTTDSRDLPAEPVHVAPSVQYSPEEKLRAEKTRKDETRQLEARLGRLSLYQKSPDGLSYVVPVTPNKPERLPESLRAVKTVKLVVPPLYPLEKSSIELQQVGGDAARATEEGFKRWVHESPRVTLMAQVNYLAHNMHLLANTPVSDDRGSREPPSAVAETKTVPQEVQTGSAKDEIGDDRSHIKVIPRPPEWSVPDTESDSDFSSDEEDSEEEASEDEEEGGAPVPEPSAANPGKGVALSLPGLELFGVELLEVKMLCVTVKCERCKELTDVKNIKPTNDPGVVSPVRAESCRKCANPMSIGFRRELMHPTSHRAGYLDLVGCTVFDLLPSNFVPTCSECSTPFPAPGIVAVRGESAFATCRECHRRMVFKIPEVKFLVVGPSALTAPRSLPRKKVKENLGIVAGQELPRRGRCAHYGKSYRWFRFSCCAKVFPCDKCHDAATDHPNEHANRMICGFCSREQIYRPEDCGICRAVLVGKSGSGFWEGGKGTRDKVRMSRKDPRKYKRRGGTTPSGSGGGGAGASSSKKK
ncbi:hypothetical protein VTN77DRAFT_3705 [Rasamsonia byssochlamydoides]|uniref:uncharacterized protein n=1 Tax=Rasamsonia byssochlamydoides TaxID=89139 RepID=UPI0037432867